MTRPANDFYRTPKEFVHAILPHLPRFEVALDLGCGDGAILNAIHEHGPSWRRNELGTETCPRTMGIEVDLDHGRRISSDHHVWWGDVLGSDVLQNGEQYRVADIIASADLTIFNAPFRQAQAFVELALEHRHPCATVAALLRLSFVESAERVTLHQKHQADLYVIPNRHDFTGGAERPCPRCHGRGFQLVLDKPEPCSRCRGKKVVFGGNDSAACGWFCWGPGRVGRRITLDPVIVGGDT